MQIKKEFEGTIKEKNANKKNSGDEISLKTQSNKKNK